MSFIKTKLSVDDKTILKEIYDELEKITIPTTYRVKGVGNNHSIKTGTTNQKDARQACFGKVTYKGEIQVSSCAKKYPHIMPLFKDFIDSHYPDFKFNSVYVNKNTICKKHLDSKNTGESILVGFGPYTGGKTTLYIDDKPKSFHIKTNSLIFNGSEIPHESESFKGTRYSLVFFK
jgi:hypothetical protein